MLKKFQVAERGDGKWVIVCVSDQISLSWQIRGSIDAIGREYDFPSEAQERADELNGVKNEESN